MRLNFANKFVPSAMVINFKPKYLLEILDEALKFRNLAAGGEVSAFDKFKCIKLPYS